MNFAQVEAANGQRVDMSGVITEFCGEGINPKSGKPWKKVKLNDGQITHNVTLRGTLPGPELLNQQASFSIATYPGNYQGTPYTGYSGFWNAKATPQNAPQQTNAPQRVSSREIQSSSVRPPARDFDAEARGKCRYGLTLKALEAELRDKTPIDYSKIAQLVEFCMTGQEPVGVAPEPTYPDDTPF